MKQLTQSAQVAKIIKTELKKRGISCKAKSSNFSMGSSVDVDFTDCDPRLVKELRKEFDRYEYGSFNAYEDYMDTKNQEFSHLPQTKYLTFNNSLSDDLTKKAFEYLRDELRPCDLTGVEIDTDPNARSQELIDLTGHWNISAFVRHHIFDYNANQDLLDHVFKKETKQEQDSKKSDCGYSVVEIFHTKKQENIYICKPDSFLSTDDFQSELERAKEMGGWYSRKFGSSPAGFGFSDFESANNFCSDCETESENQEEKKSEAKKDRSKISEKYLSFADDFKKKASAKNTNQLANTDKRKAQLNNAILDQQKLDRCALVCEKLAGKSLDDNFPVFAEKLTKKEIEEKTKMKTKSSSYGYHHYRFETGEQEYTDQLANYLFSLIDPNANRIENEIRLKINGIGKIESYFPTPKNVIEILTDDLDLDGKSILEPSAGSGNIADYLRDKGAIVDCCEINRDLREILRLKNHSVIERDIMELNIPKKYDLVIMNPPFERLQDIEHIKKSFEFLAEGGTLRSIISPSITFHGSKKAIELRSWLESVKATFTDLPEKSFAESGTSVNTMILEIVK